MVPEVAVAISWQLLLRWLMGNCGWRGCQGRYKSSLSVAVAGVSDGVLLSEVVFRGAASGGPSELGSGTSTRHGLPLTSKGGGGKAGIALVLGVLLVLLVVFGPLWEALGWVRPLTLGLKMDFLKVTMILPLRCVLPVPMRRVDDPGMRVEVPKMISLKPRRKEGERRA